MYGADSRLHRCSPKIRRYRIYGTPLVRESRNKLKLSEQEARTMAKLNTLNLNIGPRTHEGAPARHISPDLQLRRSVLACLLWESQFYEDGVEVAGRIAELVPKVTAERVAALAIEAREQMKLRHAPLLLVREMARHKTHRHLVSDTLARVIQRAD